jgi:cobalt-zinc-cadmium resistance protein CzcA
MTGTKSDIAVKIYGDDLNELYDRAQEAVKIISDIPGAADIRVEQIIGLPQLIIQYDRDKIAQYGLNIVQLNNTVRTAFAGAEVGSIFENDRKFDLVIRIDKSYRNDLDLNTLSVQTPAGTVIPISEVAIVVANEGPMQISRDNTRRRVNVGINVRGRDIQSLVDEIDMKLTSNLKLKPGYYLVYGGQFENLKNARKRLSIAVPIALLLILILLFFTFSSFRYALLIFSAVPLSAVGGIAALWIRGIPFSISAGVGFIALFGVAVLNGIVLISYYLQMQKAGIVNVNYIVLKGASTRLRPVLMTASTDILGFLPMAASISAGAEVQRPLATVVIGGIVTSTMLTLIILPILFLMMNSKDGLTFRPPRRKKRRHILSFLLMFFLVLPLIQAQDTTPTVITMQQAVDSTIAKNLRVRNASLRIDQAKAGKMGAWDLTPTSAKFEFGQINSTASDRYFEINQNFGSILEHIQRLKTAKANQQMETTAYELEIKKLTAEARSAFTFWQYMDAYSALLKEEMDMYQQLADVAEIRYKLGDIDLLSQSMAFSKVSEVTSRYLNSLDELVIAENKLKQLMMTSGNFVPGEFEPHMYMIEKSSDTASYSGNLIIRYYSDRFEMIKAQEATTKAQYFPEVWAGYFTQEIDDRYNLNGWQIGISVPLWIPKQQADIKQRKIESEIAYNELEYQKYMIETTIENLLFELNKYFRQIRHYTQTAVPQAEILLKTALLQLETEEIDYTQYLQSVSLAIQIKTEYFQAVNNYNQTAIQLEIYGN